MHKRNATTKAFIRYLCLIIGDVVITWKCVAPIWIEELEVSSSLNCPLDLTQIVVRLAGELRNPWLIAIFINVTKTIVENIDLNLNDLNFSDSGVMVFIINETFIQKPVCILQMSDITAMFTCQHSRCDVA